MTPLPQSCQFLQSIEAAGAAYNSIQVLVGGDHVSDIIRHAFVHFDTIKTDQASKFDSMPRGRKKVVEATISYALHVQSTMGNITLEHIDPIIVNMEQNWDSIQNEIIAEEKKQDLPPPLTQREKNQLLAKEVMEIKKRDREMFERGDYTMNSAEKEVDWGDANLRGGEEAFLGTASTNMGSVEGRMRDATRSKNIGIRRFQIKDFYGASKAFRFSFFKLNFSNKKDIGNYLEHKTVEIEKFVEENLEKLHCNLAASLIEMSLIEIETSPTQSMIYAAESASQASGAIELNGDNVKAIYLRGKGRMLADDFEASRIDLREAKVSAKAKFCEQTKLY